MHIKEIVIRNFRILLDSRIELDKQPCLLIGRNNAGKTSFMVLIEKFLKNQRFDYNDFPVKLRSKLLDISPDTDVTELAIQLMLTIHYEENDNLRNLSEFIVDLDPRCMEVYLLFECSIDKDGLLSAYAKAEGVSKASFIRKHLEEHLKTQIYTFDDPTVMYNDRKRMVAKKLSDVRNLIDLEIIHAKRSVASSEESKGSRVLSTLTTSYFNAQNSSDSAKFDEINSLILLWNPVPGKEKKLEKSQKLIYVACSRARKNLACIRILTSDEEALFKTRFPQAERIDISEFLAEAEAERQEETLLD